MAHNIESMDIDEIDTNFDNKENAFQHNSMLPITPSTEKGYEELDVSELNIKLRYSITPTSSPMSKSFTANCADSRDGQNNQNTLYDNGNVKETPNIMTLSDTTAKMSNIKPLQLINSDQVVDSNRNTSVLRPLNSAFATDNVMITMTAAQDSDDNISLPSSSSSLVHTPEATTPTKEAPKQDGGSPILRGIKTVLNMFRSSQSPIPNSENVKPVEKHLLKPQNHTQDSNELRLKNNLISTPIKSQDGNDPDTFKRSSPHKESVTFNDDLERELQWSDESSIYFDDEKIPIHKLIYQKPQICCNKTNITEQEGQMLHEGNNLNETVEYMDISYNNSILSNRTITDWKEEKQYMTVDSDNEFLDCETTFTKNEPEMYNNESCSNLQVNLTHTLDTEINYNQNELSSDLEPMQTKQQDLNVTKDIIESLPTNKEQNITPALEAKFVELAFSPNTRSVQIEKLSEKTTKNEELIKTNATMILNISDNNSAATQLQNTLSEPVRMVEEDLDTKITSHQTIDVISSHPESSDLSTTKIIVGNDLLNNMNTEFKDIANLSLQSSIHEQTLTKENINISARNYDKNLLQVNVDSLQPVDVPLPDDNIDEKTCINLNEIKDEHFVHNLSLPLNTETVPQNVCSQVNNYSTIDDSKKKSNLSEAFINTIVPECETIESQNVKNEHLRETIEILCYENLAEQKDADLDLTKIKSINEENECVTNIDLPINNLVNDTKIEEDNKLNSQFLLLPHKTSDSLVTKYSIKPKQDSFLIQSKQSSGQLQANTTNPKYPLENQINKDKTTTLSDTITQHSFPVLPEQVSVQVQSNKRNDQCTSELQINIEETVILCHRETDKVDGEAIISERCNLYPLEQLNKTSDMGMSEAQVTKDETVSVTHEVPAKVVKEPIISKSSNLDALEQSNKTNAMGTPESQVNEVLANVVKEPIISESSNLDALEQSNKTKAMGTPEPQVNKVLANVVKEPIISENNNLSTLEQSNETNDIGTPEAQVNKVETVSVTHEVLAKFVKEPIISESINLDTLEQQNKTNAMVTPETQVNEDKTVSVTHEVPAKIVKEPIISESSNLDALEPSNKTNAMGTPETQVNEEETVSVTNKILANVVTEPIIAESSNFYTLEQSNKTNDMCTPETQVNKDETVNVTHEVLGNVVEEPILSESTNLYTLEQSIKTNDMGTPDPQVNKDETVSITYEVLANDVKEPIISESCNIYALDQSNKTNKNETGTLNHRVTHEVLGKVDAELKQNNDKGTLEPQSNDDETYSRNDRLEHEFVVEVDAKVTKTESKNSCNSIATDIVVTKLITSDPSDSPVETIDKSSIPSSPPIKSKGYNFNFVEIDDPFITNTRIEVTPPPMSESVQKSKPTTNTNLESTKEDANKNRKSVQPIQKKMTANTSETFDDKLNFDDKFVNDIKDQQKPYCGEVPISKETLSLIQTENELLNTTKALENTLVEDKKANFDETVSKNPSEFKFLSENPVKSDEIVVNNIDVTDDAGSSPLEDASVKNVFNLPKIDGTNFNPFLTKCKLTESVPDSNTFNTGISTLNNVCDVTAYVENCNPTGNTQVTIAETFNVEICNIENAINTTGSSKESDDKDTTVKEIHTEDEDTEEGPFLEANEVLEAEKLTEFSTEKDMIRFSDVHQPPTAPDEGELFIDAQAFEFLMNQNANEVADSGKESLFLKFDPLFSRRIGADGIVSALSDLRKRQSTPRKASKSPDLHYNESFDLTAVAASSTFNLAHNNTITEENNDINITVSKPMMAVPPAVNQASTRNKASTPTRTNRRSMTFASPAIAMIDRLLSMSGNNLYVSQDTTVTTQDNEADLALLELREVLAEKEEQVLNLRIESEELKDRLANLESQMRGLEADSEDRLKKVNELTEKLADKTKMNKNMATLVEEYERTIASLITETEQEKKLHAEERLRLVSERDEQTAHLASMEVSFSDLHSKYEKSKQMILGLKANEETYEKSMKEFEENYNKMLSNYELLKQHATSKLNHANQELEKMKRSHNAEVMKLNAMIKRKDMHITSLEETLAQKTKANEELTAICDELINKVG